jgi:hypothetical protein
LFLCTFFFFFYSLLLLLQHILPAVLPPNAIPTPKEKVGVARTQHVKIEKERRGRESDKKIREKEKVH